MCNQNYKIVFSNAISKEKATTFGFNKIECNSLSEFQKIVNEKAISNSIFLRGHRNQEKIKAMGSIYILDFDEEPLNHATPYYLIVEELLQNLNIAYVSVPSASADKFTYKRHIIIILSDCINHSKDIYLKFEDHLFNTLKIDLSKVDNSLLKNRAIQIAPASINKQFIDYNLKSTYFEGKPYQVNVEYLAKTNYHETSLNYESLINCENGKVISINDVKKLVNVGSKLSCFCPIHNDIKKTSATIFHNLNGSIVLYCHVCGKIPIQSSFFKNKNYDLESFTFFIKLKNKKNSLTYLESPSYKTKDYSIWYFNVNNINDIYKIMLAKKQMIDDNFILDNNLRFLNEKKMIDTNILNKYISNTNALDVYISSKSNTKLSPFNEFYIHVKKYIFNGYLSLESIIWLIYQNFHNLDFKTLCNYGLSYYEYIQETMLKEKNFKFQKDKKFPIKLNEIDRKNNYKDREKKRYSIIESRMNNIEKKIYKLLDNPNYKKKNGTNNISKIARKLNINRCTVSSYVQNIIKKTTT